jgi:hypothetical protein
LLLRRSAANGVVPPDEERELGVDISRLPPLAGGC